MTQESVNNTEREHEGQGHGVRLRMPEDELWAAIEQAAKVDADEGCVTAAARRSSRVRLPEPCGRCALSRAGVKWGGWQGDAGWLLRDPHLWASVAESVNNSKLDPQMENRNEG